MSNTLKNFFKIRKLRQYTNICIFYSERQRKYKEKIYNNPKNNPLRHQQKKEKDRILRKASYDRVKNDPIFKKTRNERQNIRRAELKKLGTKRNVTDSLSPLGNYRSKSSFGKAVKKAGEALPKSSPNRKAK